MPWNMEEPSLLLGRLIERSDAMLERMARIDQRQAETEAEIRTVRSQIGKLESVQSEGLPGWEKAVKALIPPVMLVGALAWTGSIDAAITLLIKIGQLIAAAKAAAP